jgi:copper chaperone
VTNGTKVTIFAESHLVIVRNDMKNTGEDAMKSIKVNGMSCSHCVKAVTEALQAIDGVDHVKVSLEKGEATFDEVKPLDISVIKENIRKAGFEVG